MTASPDGSASGKVPNDLGPFWMPFTANRQYKANPRLLVSAEGVYYTSHDGRKILDGQAGLWCVNAGHAHKKIVEAVQKQIAKLDFAPTFNMGHPLPFELAGQLAALTPGDLDHVFFCNSGSEAVDTALKIALAYHRARGEGTRTRFIGRERGYHGVGFGGIAVGGMVGNRKAFGNSLISTDHLPHTHSLKDMAFSQGQPEWGAHLADELERIIALHDASNIAAVIVEPVAGSTGVLVPPKGYLEKLRAITQKHGILLIFDEVITGFGRLGKSFAAEYFNIIPDLMTVAKGITNGVIPMGAVFARDMVHDAIVTGPEGAIELFHGYTYSGHPVACAASLATLEVYREEGLFERAAKNAVKWQKLVHELKDDKLADLRNLGMMGAIEFKPREGAPGARGYEAFLHCYENGLLVRFGPDVLSLTPPLTISESELDFMFSTLRNAIKAVK
ncbi:MAG: aspartate aminotransferase family protein [Candidatus Pacebacteria bacterium]|nr:aspartate aminotransferase family protein [Candidatus Paceibacterota bacterium]